AGSTALSFLTQKSRWASLAAQAAVQWAFLEFAYVVGIGLALVAARFYPDGLAMSPRGWACLTAHLRVGLQRVTKAPALAGGTGSGPVGVPRIRVRRRHRPRTRRGEVLSRRAGHVAAGVGLSRGLSPRRSPVGDDGDGACRPHALRRGVRRRADHVDAPDRT